MDNKCQQCGGKFGMTLHHFDRMRFCKLVCKETFMKNRQQQISIAMFRNEKPPDQFELPFHKPPDKRYDVC